MAVAVMRPSSPLMGPQRRIYSGEATEHALTELIKCDKDKAFAAAQPFLAGLEGRVLEPYFCEGAAHNFTTPKKSSFEKKIGGGKKAVSSEVKGGKPNGRFIAAKRASPIVKAKPNATAGSTAQVLAPAPHCLPPPPQSLLG